jgi:hypothetical protein
MRSIYTLFLVGCMYILIIIVTTKCVVFMLRIDTTHRDHNLSIVIYVVPISSIYTSYLFGRMYILIIMYKSDELSLPFH